MKPGAEALAVPTASSTDTRPTTPAPLVRPFGPITLAWLLSPTPPRQSWVLVGIERRLLRDVLSADPQGHDVLDPRSAKIAVITRAFPEWWYQKVDWITYSDHPFWAMVARSDINVCLRFGEDPYVLGEVERVRNSLSQHEGARVVHYETFTEPFPATATVVWRIGGNDLQDDPGLEPEDNHWNIFGFDLKAYDGDTRLFGRPWLLQGFDLAQVIRRNLRQFLGLGPDF